MKAKIPSIPYIPRHRDTEKLYRLERKTVESIKAAAVEHAVVADLIKGTVAEPEKEAAFYEMAVPEQLALMLDSFPPAIGIAAALGYLTNQGFDVSNVTKSRPGRHDHWYEVAAGWVELKSVEPKKESKGHVPAP